MCRRLNRSLGLLTAGAPKGQAGTTLVYDIATDKWTINDPALTTPRSDCCLSAVDGKLYVAGEPSGCRAGSPSCLLLLAAAAAGASRDGS